MATETELRIVSVDTMDGTQVVVEFSDGTVGVYSASQLAEMPGRRPMEEQGAGQA